ncbi:MAG: hypothetical protein LBU65_09725 [Planctomycetaceae bacterium]|jgi:hypothetical protein|nr:hypothetical protein [Planctomycetaceae bacterium]
MRKIFRLAFVFVCVAYTVFVSSSFAQKPLLPSMVVPDGLGYNIHFTDAKTGEMEMIAESGAAIVRMDFGWGGTEREKGVYDFSAFERLTDSLEKHKIRPLYILDYSNRLYDDGLSPHSEEGRAAFAKWAAAAAVHFKGRGIIWEMYNEPNIGFWKPKPDAEKFILLALEVGKALRAAVPDEVHIGPATSEIDIDFLEKCFKAGLLEYWDAVSVHPYRQTNPETAISEYAKLRYVIDRYAPHGKRIPILSAEWGYSTAWNNFNEVIQSEYLPRQWMTNLACDVPISIWYDWHDDGTDPKEPEHHFGTTNHEYRKDTKPVYAPKLSYLAAKTFNETFRGFKFNKRLWVNDPDVHVFLFNKGDEVKLAVWTTSKEPKSVVIPCSPNVFTVVSHTGHKLSELTASGKDGLELNVYSEPRYMTPKKQGGFWKDVLKLKSLPLTVYGSTIQCRSQQEGIVSIQTAPSRLAEYNAYYYAEHVQDILVAQHTRLYAVNPIQLSLPIPEKDKLVIKVVNPSGEPLSGEEITIKQADGIELTETTRALKFEQGEKEKTLSFPIKSAPKGEYKFAVSATSFPDAFPLRTMKLIDDFSTRTNETLADTWGVYPDGDAKVESKQTIEMSDGMMRLSYEYGEGWKFVCIKPKGDLQKIEGKPKALGLRIDGNSTGGAVNIRFIDSTGQTFQVHGGKMNESKQYYFEFSLDGTTSTSHWGGANDGKITYPIRFDSIIIDGTRRATGQQTVTISSPVWIY